MSECALDAQGRIPQFRPSFTYSEDILRCKSIERFQVPIGVRCQADLIATSFEGQIDEPCKSSGSTLLADLKRLPQISSRLRSGSLFTMNASSSGQLQFCCPSDSGTKAWGSPEKFDRGHRIARCYSRRLLPETPVTGSCRKPLTVDPRGPLL